MNNQQVINEFSIENNPYQYLYADITYNCNLNCSICFNSQKNNNFPDMTLEYFEEVCKRLPKRVLFRLMGGEPTLHPQLSEFIKVANKYKHTVSIVTNGIKLAELDYVKKLKKLHIPLIIAMTLDGGLNNNKVYKMINGIECADLKIQALSNMINLGFRRIGITSIVVRDVNEFVIPELLSLAEKHSGHIRFVHFRTMCQVGKWLDTEPYTLLELKGLLQKNMLYENIDKPFKMILNGKDAPEGHICRQCCFRFINKKGIQISLIEFGSENSAKCWQRGKLLNKTFKIKPFFAEMREEFK